jgi:hypothetical protein
MRGVVVWSMTLVVAAWLFAAPAPAKEGVVATLQTPMPSSAAAGTELDVSWTLASTDEKGKPVPFGASGVFIELYGANGAATTFFASGDGGRDGEFSATVIVPNGGIAALKIGLGGTSSTATGTSPSNLYFPVKNSPFPSDPPAGPVGAGTPVGMDDDGVGGPTIVGLVLGATGLLLAGALAGAAWHRRRPHRHPSPTAPQ